MDKDRLYAGIARQMEGQDGQAMQHFMSNSAWPAAGVYRQIQTDICATPQLFEGRKLAFHRTLSLHTHSPKPFSYAYGDPDVAADYRACRADSRRPANEFAKTTLTLTAIAIIAHMGSTNPVMEASTPIPLKASANPTLVTVSW